MKYELKITTDELVDIKLHAKSEDFYCALVEILDYLRDKDKHEPDQDNRDVSIVREGIYKILEHRKIDLEEFDV